MDDSPGLRRKGSRATQALRKRPTIAPKTKSRTGRSKPRTTDLRPWLWGAALAGSSEHSSPRSRTGPSLVRGKGMLNKFMAHPLQSLRMLHFLKLHGEEALERQRNTFLQPISGQQESGHHTGLDPAEGESHRWQIFPDRQR